MIAQAISSYHKPRWQIEIDKESNQLDDNAGAPEHPVKNPYAETKKSKWRKLMSKGLSKKSVKKGSKFGRPVGTKNKPGHRAGGDRTSSAYKRKKQAQTKGFDGPLDHLWGEGGNRGDRGRG